MLLRRGTTDTFRVGPFLDTSGIAVATALTISSADVQLSKDGAAFGAKAQVGGGTHDAFGWYSIDLSTADTGTLGKFQISVQNASALPVWHELMVVPENVYDSLISDTALLFVDSTILNNSSHGNAALQVTIDAIKAETTLIHAETTAMSTILANSSHGNANLLTVLTSVHDESTKMSTVLDNSSHGNAAILARGNTAWLTASSANAGFSTAAGGAVTDWTTAERNQMRTALGITGTTAALSGNGLIEIIQGETSAIHVETSAIKAVVENSSHGNANLLVVLTSVRDEASAIHAETTKMSTVLDNSSHGNAAMLARGNTAWITASGFSTVTPSTVVSLSTAGNAGVWNHTIEDTLSAGDIQKINLAALAGETTGGGTTQVKFKGQTTTIDRIIANLSSVQDRVSITLSTA